MSSGYFKIDITSKGKFNFENALKIAFNDFGNDDLNREQKAECYKILSDNTLILYFYNPSDGINIHELPYKMNIEQIIPFVWGFLENAEIKDREPDIDGSVHPGWRIWNGCHERNSDFNLIDSWVYDGGLICAIKPVWLEYHK